MKVAHLISSKIFAGIEQHVYELSSSMSDASNQIIICEYLEPIFNDLVFIPTM